MVSQSAIDYLRLSLIPGVGAYTAGQLIESFGSAANIWAQSPSDWKAVEGVGPKLISALLQGNSDSINQEIDARIQACHDDAVQLICPTDSCWPKGLIACSDAPLVLYIKGKADVLQMDKTLAMVGARKASAEGKLIARRWSSFCSRQGVVVISGMAPGIDSAAHGGSLDAGKAGIAVLGYGLKAGSTQQYKQIEALAEQGCVISEYAPKVVARAAYFPQRNRLIAGISQALIVIEGGLKSGSLITARQAINYGREVFAVPGSVLNDVHAGCHQLIKDGANIASDASDVLQSLGWNEKQEAASNYEPRSALEAKIMALVARQIMHVDALAEDCDLTVPELSTILLALELGGVIEKLPGSRYTLS